MRGLTLTKFKSQQLRTTRANNELGLVTDIHNDAIRLRRALELLADHKVDQIITIGDTFDPLAKSEGIAEVAELLMECKAVGVWGNHDYIFCRETPEDYYDRYPATLFEHLKRVGPAFVQRDTDIGDLHFSHREHDVDPYDPLALWDLTGEEIDNPERAQRALNSSIYAAQFVGHYHAWMAFDCRGQIDWSGQEPLQLETAQRYFIVVAAVCDGWCAVLNDEQRVLIPMRL